MNRFLKAIAAIMLMSAVVATVGCNKKPDNPDDPEQTVTLAGMWYANDLWFENEHDRVAIDFVNSNTLIWYGTVSTNKNAIQNMEGTTLDGCAGWYYFSKTYYTYVLTDNKIFFNDRIFTIFENYLIEDGTSWQWVPWTNGNGGGGGDVPSTVTVTTYNPTDITSTEATCGADVTAENGSNIRELGICWGTAAYPTVENSHLSTTTWNTPFVCTISDLVPETRYHVRAYALNGTSYVYGDDKIFTTLAEGGGGGQTYTITAAANPINGGMVIGSGTYQEGQQCTLIAIANSEYDFVNWTENGTEVSSDMSYTFAVSANRQLVANFIQQASQYYTISVSANPSMGGVVSGGGTYQQGQSCTVNAVANYGYSFENWTENGTLCSMDEDYSFVVNGNRSLVANFAYNGGSGGDDDYVDLGLPSGLLWATRNVGASRPEDYGDYFAWGETQMKNTYDWSTYQYCMGSSHTLTKYCDKDSYGYNGFTDNLTVLLPEDDAVTANWGLDWRMPTKEEWQELLDNCTSVWTTQNGVHGRCLTGANGNTLFLPAAGRYGESGLLVVGSCGFYWSSTLNTDNPTNAWYFTISSGCSVISCSRYLGHPVRAVRKN